MDQFHERLDALEQQLHMLTQHTHTVTRRLRWWRGLACSLAVAGLLSWGLPLGLAREDAPDKEKGEKGLAQRVAALEQLLKHFSREKNEIFITGANLHIVNGLDSTDCGSEEEPIPDCPNGLGNLIVGYNESRKESFDCEFEGTDEFCQDIRTGSHNVVVGQFHNFSRFGGLVVGNFNTISGDFAAVSGGNFNTASGRSAAVSGGRDNEAISDFASVIGGSANVASGPLSSVSGGSGNTANGPLSSVSGGSGNAATGASSSISGGIDNAATGIDSTVSGGSGNTASGAYSSVSGGGRNPSTFEGEGNTASGDLSSVSGGQNITQATEFGWSAGSEADEVVVGNFRSP